MSDETLPRHEVIVDLLAEIEGLIGLGASFPHDRYKLDPTFQDGLRYQQAWAKIEYVVVAHRGKGFPIFHANRHQTLKSMWAWCWSIEGSAKDRMLRPRQLYAALIAELEQLKDILAKNPVAPAEVLRDLRESAHLTNELFVIMAMRPETDDFWSQIVEPAAAKADLKPIRIDKEETEVAISEEILSAIRRSTLVLCDLSFELPNCYFEAGYAKGAFRRVIFSARHDHDPRLAVKDDYKVHLDVDQLEITWWHPSDLDAARQELENRLQQLKAQLWEHD